jgi:lipopolysaccharide/colanic/teichoic acid biosynthesis glycosyltransferase
MHFTKDMQRNSTPVGALTIECDVATPDYAAAALERPRNPELVAAILAPEAAHQPSIYSTVFKRGFDMLCLILAAPVIVPVIAFLAGLVALEGGKPFYTQARVGRDGRIYTMWKLRTMVAHADAKLADYLASNPAAQFEWDTTQKLKNDPRITRMGRLLRKTSLDELPQLINVAKGEMSLVGPRPMLPEQQDMYPGTAYYEMRPGITGPWQVSSRNESTFAARAYFDTRYARSVSLLEDLKMLFRTVGVVARATGH